MEKVLLKNWLMGRNVVVEEKTERGCRDIYLFSWSLWMTRNEKGSNESNDADGEQ